MEIKKIIFPIYSSGLFQMISRPTYVLRGRIPWSFGYSAYKNRQIKKNIDNKHLQIFNKKKLPTGYGSGLDERIVEYPWLLSNIPKSAKTILDAGSVLNDEMFLKHKSFKEKNIIIANLNPEQKNYNHLGVSYLYGNLGDLRKMIVEGGVFDVIVCGSVLEHIGMDNAKIYKNKLDKKKKTDYLNAVKEFHRILKKGGVCLITVPFGRGEDLGWFQVFDSSMVKKVVKVFGEENSTIDFFKYTQTGWQKSSSADSGQAEYFDIHTSKRFKDNKQAAAGAVACIKLTKK